jgi:uncharacterized protein involved in exopolysaccharide biosynthesis
MRTENPAFTAFDLLYVLKREVKILVGLPILVAALAFCATYLVQPQYTAVTKILPPQQQSSAALMLQGLGSLGGLAGAASGIKNPTDQYISFLRSRGLMDSLSKEYSLRSRYEAKYQDEVYKTLEKKVKISGGKDGLIVIEVDDKDPAFAAKLANSYVEELKNVLDRLSVSESRQRRIFFERQLAKAKQDLEIAQIGLGKSGVGRETIQIDPKAAVESYAALKAKITNERMKLAAMRLVMTDRAPEIKIAEKNIQMLESELIASDAVSGNEKGRGDYISLYRDYRYHEILFEMYSRQYELARNDEQREGQHIQVLDFAVPPELKSSPKRALVSVLAGLLSGFFLVFIVLFRQSVRLYKANGDGVKPEAVV